MAEPSTTVDFIQALGLLLLPGAVTIGSTMVVAALKKRGLDTMYFETVARAGGIAFTSFKTSGASISDKVALRAAALDGAKYLAERMPDYVKEKNLSVPAQIDIIQGELGTLLPNDKPRN